MRTRPTSQQPDRLGVATAFLVLLGGAAACGNASAQQRTTGDIISENYRKGRATREAWDERRARADERRREEEEARLCDAARQTVQEVVGAVEHATATGTTEVDSLAIAKVDCHPVPTVGDYRART